MAVMKLSQNGSVVSHTFEVGGEVRLSALISAAGITLNQPCGGQGTCGKCTVLAKGAILPADEQETRILDRLALKESEGYTPRLACRCSVAGDVDVIIQNIAQPETTTYESIAIQYADKSLQGLGVAIDIGTTTVSTVLLNLTNGTVLADTHAMNSQCAYGADVISRIQYATENGVTDLQRVLAEQLSGMMAEVCEKAGVAIEGISRIVATGNTTMLHTLAGLDPSGIGVAPFTPQSLFGLLYDAREFFPAMAKGCELYLPPCISAYVGADIVCGMLACGMSESDSGALLVDIGTNGEMAFVQNSSIRTCATAAGPAFEGAQIEMGMAATTGAIDKVTAEDGRLLWHSINDGKPVGLCGTGMVSAVKAMLQTQMLDGSGRIEDSHGDNGSIVEDAKGKRVLIGDSGVYLSQQDLRNIQLAKAAIAAGIYTLLDDAGKCTADVATLYIGGGFGSFLNVAEAEYIGLIPQGMAGKAKAVGNCALSGAVRMLFSESARVEGERLADTATELSLSSSKFFMDSYVDNMSFIDD